MMQNLGARRVGESRVAQVSSALKCNENASLSGFCPGARFPWIAPVTCANEVPLETVRDRWVPMGCGPNVDHAGSIGAGSRPLADTSALESPVTWGQEGSGSTTNKCATLQLTDGAKVTMWHAGGTVGEVRLPPISGHGHHLR